MGVSLLYFSFEVTFTQVGSDYKSSHKTDFFGDCVVFLKTAVNVPEESPSSAQPVGWSWVWAFLVWVTSLLVLAKLLLF